MTTLQASNSNNKGVLITLPDVNALPYFTTVTYNAIPLDEATATALNTGFAAYNQGLATAVANNLIDADEQAQRTISFAAGNNAFTIEDETLTDLSGLGLSSIRQATADDLTVITASSLLGTDNTGPQDVWGLSATSALGDEYVLLPSEQQAITTARNAMNATIKSIVDGDANLALFDAAAFMDDLAANGYDYGSGKLTTSFVTGGAFSLDGIHLTPRGNAVAANQIIGVINQAFGANIPVVDPVTYSTVTIK